MNKMLTAVAVSAVTAWAVGFSAMASAEATVYGRVVAGAVYSDNDGGKDDDGAWNFGAVGIDGGNGFDSSRFGFKGSTDLGNGLEAGFKIEREIDGGNATSQRHNNVYLSGGFGKVTLGNDSNPYMSARNWDQTNFAGGWWGLGSGYRHEGIKYSMSTGAFSLDVMVLANDSTADNSLAKHDADSVASAFLARLADVDAAQDAVDAATAAVADSSTTDTQAALAAAEDAHDAAIAALTAAENNGAAAGIDVATETNPVTDADRVIGDAAVAAANALGATGGNGYGHTVDCVGATATTNPCGNALYTAYNGGQVSGDDGIDGWIIRAGYDFGVVNLNVAHSADGKEVKVNEAAVDPTASTANGASAAEITALGNSLESAHELGRGFVDANASRDNTAIGVNGSAGPVDWYLSYQNSELNTNGYENDVDSIGGFLGFNMSEKDVLYAYHVAHSADRPEYDVQGDVTLGEDYTETIFGYSRQIGPGVKFIAEYAGQDLDLAEGGDTSLLYFAVKMDF